MTTSTRQRTTARSRAEDEFLAAQKKNKKVLEDKERERDEKSQHVAKLKAQRLAKEAVEREEAEREAAAKPAKPVKATKTVKPIKAGKKKPAGSLPQFHRF
ncbi:MAG: hypothetical protein RIG67_11595 [Rhodospirillales bacterium]